MDPLLGRAGSRSGSLLRSAAAKRLERSRVVLSAVAVVLTAGCASVPMAPPAADLAAKKFEPLPGTASLYVYRNESFGSAIRMNVALNGVLLGDTGPKTYLYTPVAPGRYVVTSKAENDSEAAIDAKAGANYFLWQEVKMGLWYARSSLQAVDELRGRAGVLECGLAKTNPPPALPGCTKDNDCKGNRICKAGACVEPPPLTN